MLPPKHFLLSILIFVFCCCNNTTKYSYAIKDFRKKLQPFLTKMVEKGIVMGNDSGLRHIATDKELMWLGRSEHPILRAAALGEMLDRKSLNHFDILMGHLDDTAQILMDAGEFGIWERTVSDYILEEAASWETYEAKNKTIELVLTKYNYLRSAYTILEQLEPQEKYYSYIKDMATRPRHPDPYQGSELGFDDIEYAMYGLAKFKNQDDVKIIKNQMKKNVWQLSHVSFRIMREFPDSTYYDVLQEYYKRKFYEFSGNRRGGFSGIIPDKAEPEDFIKALVMQQSVRSAKLLDTILSRLPLQTCMPYQEDIINETIIEIWKHPCSAYAKLREETRPKAQKITAWSGNIPADLYKQPLSYISANSHQEPLGTLPIDPKNKPSGTIKRLIRWYN
jgi:hypothetical protein